MSARQGRRAIVGYVYALLVFVVATAVVVLGITVVRFRTESRSNEDLARFHVRTLTITSEIASRLAAAREFATDEPVASGSGALAAQRRLTGAVGSVAQGIDEIAALQRDLGEPVFEGTVARLVERAEILRGAVDEGSWTPERWTEELAAVGLATFQLDRLHSITIENELLEIGRTDRRFRLLTLVLVPVAVVICGLVVARLIRLVRIRLQELDDANEALLRTRARLEQSERLEALSTMIGGVAHDFNNLLTSILGHAEIGLLRSDPGDAVSESLVTIRRSGEQAAGLTRQLLAFSRNEAGQPEPTDLNLLIRDMVPVLRGLARDDIELEIAYANPSGMVLVDPVQMEQVLLNLVVNARDAMPTGGRLLLRTDSVVLPPDSGHPGSGAFVRVRVQDTGSGMPPEVLHRVFEPFFTTKQPGHGTGLGLAMVHGIVTGSDGFVEVDSEVGVRTRFDVYLPDLGVVDPSSPPDEPDDEPGGSETILVIEDEPQIRALLDDALTSLGYRVLIADGGERAIALHDAEQQRVDLVLTDVVMAGMRGPDVVAELRRSNPELAVVYMSGYSDDSVLGVVQASGDDFVAKPFKLRDLTRIVRRRLDRDRSGSTATARSPRLP